MLTKMLGLNFLPQRVIMNKPLCLAKSISPKNLKRIKKRKKKIPQMTRGYFKVEILQKLSLLIPCDSTGVFLSRIFHIYQHNYASVGVFTKVSIRVTKPRCRVRKKRKLRAFIVRTAYPHYMPDRSFFITTVNSGVLLKKRLSMRGRIVFGPAIYTVKRKKFLKSFARVL